MTDQQLFDLLIAKYGIVGCLHALRDHCEDQAFRYESGNDNHSVGWDRREYLIRKCMEDIKKVKGFDGDKKKGEKKYLLSTEEELRREFWRQHPHLPQVKIPHYSGNREMFPVIVRVAWTDWKDAMCKAGEIGQELKDNATL